MSDLKPLPAQAGTFFQTHRWSILLALLVALILLDGFEDRVHWADSAGLWGLSALFVGIVGATGHNTVLRIAMGVPVVAWILLIVLHEFWGVKADGLLAALAGILLFGAMITSFWQLIGPVHSEYERLSSGVFGYLLMAMLWGVIYWRIEAAHPGAFNLPPDVQGERAPFVYFSMITMTTVGYGEMTPAASLPRVLTGLQAIVGTMFVAIFIGRIVGRLK
ncbi:two pore domain potassium channel family protein [Shimia sp. R10_1]|uniref:potassium channel family protein n=1 Tax=Shimia sp. R10_1 TaxID=2821095 RepID=UPI001AD9DF8A|nr:two pore domain potassium channel family protein [Shimia sp. R10_1]